MTRVVSNRVRVMAPAKINLALRILGTRPDGYHELRTTFQSVALHDTLTFTAVPGVFTIDCDEPRCPTDDCNLVWRAARAIWRGSGRGGEPEGVRVRIRKQIPLQAGLGGGSSNAAAALRALAVLWRLKIDRDRLRTMARGLGADVPFFLDGGTVLGVDRGDTLSALTEAPPHWVVLAWPTFGISTADAFRWWDDDHPDENHAEEQSSVEPGNDLERLVTARHPEISRTIKRLKKGGATLAAMSGSGSAVFGLFDSERQARTAARLSSRRRLTIAVTRTLSRRQYQTLSRPRRG